MAFEVQETPSLRAGLLERLRAHASSALAGRGQSCLVHGPAGIGKTWLSKQLCHVLPVSLAPAIIGHGEIAPGTPALWPFIEVMRGLEVRATALNSELLSALSPWLAPAREAAEPTKQRYFLLCDELMRVLLAAARAAPLCLVFEDLHDFDHASLALLARLLRNTADAPLFVLGTCRVHESTEPELERALRSFEHVFGVPRLSLAEVEGWLERALPASAPRQLSRQVYERAEGNPLFVASLAQLLAAGERASLELPASLRLAAARQLAMLAPDCRALLRQAAVLGRELEPELLQRTGVSACALAPQLEAACQCGVLQRATGYRFAHALLREVLLEELTPRQLRAAHLAAARALAPAQHAAFDAQRESRRARHYLEAGCRPGYERAVELYTALGKAAGSRGAHQEASEAFAHAVSAQRQLPGERARRELGRCQLREAHALWRAGDHARARGVCREVSELAEALADASLRVEAALGALGTDMPVQLDCAQIALCERALASVADERSPHAIMLGARLGTLLCFSVQRARGVALIARAAELFDAQPDPALEFHVLLARYYALPDTAAPEARKALIDRGLAIAPDAGSALWLRYWEVRWHLEHGELRTAGALCSDFARAADAWGDPMPRWNARMASAAYAMRTGELAKAEASAEEALSLGRAASAPNAELAFVAQRVNLERLRGRAAQVIELVQAGADRFTHLLDFRAALAAMRAELGEWRAAQLEFARACSQLAAHGGEAETVYALCELAQTAWELSRAPAAHEVFGSSERAACELLQARLAPLAQRWVVLSQAQACGGPVLGAIGVLSLALGRAAEGCAQLAAALAASHAAGAQTAVAQLQLQLAQCLGESAEAREHAQRALRASEALGLEGLAERARAQVGLTPSAAGPAHSSGDCEFVLVGELWRLAFDGQRCMLSDRKGMRYLERLLAMPESNVHVLALIVETDAGSPAIGIAYEDGLRHDARIDAPERTLDARSALAYRRRLRELEEQHEEASKLHDLGRVQRITAEVEFLHHELASGARVRHAPTERARKAIYNRIQHAIQRIAAQHESLAKHLSRSIKTGNYCSYEPETRLEWRTSFS